MILVPEGTFISRSGFNRASAINPGGKMKRVLITGAAGNLGRKLTNYLQGRYDLQLLDRKSGDYADIHQADLAHWDPTWVEQFSDVDTVVHLAANPNRVKSHSVK